MKKVLFLFLILFSFTNLQAQDTNCVLIAGKATFYFNYYTNTIDSTIVDEKSAKKLFLVKPNEVLVVDLYDDNKHVRSVHIKRRKITICKRGKKAYSFWTKSGNKSFYFEGKEIEMIIVGRAVL